MRSFLLSLLCGFSACASAPPNASVMITSRLGWEQGSNIQQARQYQFTATIDKQRPKLLEVTCIEHGEESSSCETTLPPMTLGKHKLMIGIIGGREMARANVLVTLDGIVFQ